MFRAISKTLLRWLGWRIELQFVELPLKYVLIAAPHTSNRDFPIGLLARSALGLDIKYLGKDSLFRWPLGTLFRWLGGYPVDRSGGKGYVESVVQLFDQKEAFAICIAPEGTRSRVERLKTGFYYIALGAGIPIIMAKFNWQSRIITVSEPFYPSGDPVSDFEWVENYFRGVPGRHPECGFGYSATEEV